MDQYAILTIGKTHTGKTTFAKEVAPKLANCAVLETDPIALFLRQHFPGLHMLDLDHSGGFSSPSLKFILFRTILSFALENRFNVILSNSNIYENGRRQVLDIIKRYKVRTVGVYLNYPEEVLIERAERSQRDIEVLRVSKDFKDLIINQRTRFQPPDGSDFDHFFEVTDPAELPAVERKIIELCK